MQGAEPFIYYHDRIDLVLLARSAYNNLYPFISSIIIPALICFREVSQFTLSIEEDL